MLIFAIQKVAESGDSHMTVGVLGFLLIAAIVSLALKGSGRKN